MSRIPVGALTRSSLQLPRAAAVHSRAVPSSRRWASSSAPKIKYGFRGGLLRWGVAAGGIYWYATQGNKLLADEPAYISPVLPHTENEDENLLTVDEISAARKARRTQSLAANSPDAAATVATPGAALGSGGAVGELEEEAEGEGAFNPETGEINWDCPCLGGMAHGPCGPEFKEAFSCFVFSKEEPKGMDCVDRFKGMQDCFRRHPEIYGDELDPDDDDEAEAEALAPGQAGAAAPQKAAVTAPVPSRDEMLNGQKEGKASPHELSSAKLARGEGVVEDEKLVPRHWHNTTDENEKPEKGEKTETKK